MSLHRIFESLFPPRTSTLPKPETRGLNGSELTSALLKLDKLIEDINNKHPEKNELQEIKQGLISIFKNEKCSDDRVLEMLSLKGQIVKSENTLDTSGKFIIATLLFKLFLHTYYASNSISLKDTFANNQSLEGEQISSGFIKFLGINDGKTENDILTSANLFDVNTNTCNYILKQTSTQFKVSYEGVIPGAEPSTHQWFRPPSHLILTIPNSNSPNTDQSRGISGNIVQKSWALLTSVAVQVTSFVSERFNSYRIHHHKSENGFGPGTKMKVIVPDPLISKNLELTHEQAEAPKETSLTELKECQIGYLVTTFERKALQSEPKVDYEFVNSQFSYLEYKLTPASINEFVEKINELLSDKTNSSTRKSNIETYIRTFFQKYNLASTNEKLSGSSSTSRNV